MKELRDEQDSGVRPCHGLQQGGLRTRGGPVAGIEPWAWIVNNSVAAAHPRSPLLRERAAHERREIDAVATRHARRYAVVALMREEPVGVARLLDMAGGRMSPAAVDHARTQIAAGDID